MIDTDWRPNTWYLIPDKSMLDMYCSQAEAREAGASDMLEAILSGNIPPGLGDIPIVVEAVLENIPIVVEAVKAKYHLVELAKDQTPPMYHSDYRDKNLYELICTALYNVGFRKLKL